MIYVNTYEAPEYSRREILRYAGVKKGVAPELEELLDSCLAEIDGRLTYKVCYGQFDISINKKEIDMGFAKVTSMSLKKCLKGCDQIFLFGATVGLELDRLIARYSSVAPSRALMLQAIGAERVESLCDLFEKDLRDLLAEDCLFLRPRFSPGYGDLPLELQRNIFAVLDCPKNIGLTLNDSLLMSPTKSVTAIIGAERHNMDCFVDME